MNRSVVRPKFTLLLVILILTQTLPSFAGSTTHSIEKTGDILQIALPVTAALMTAAYQDMLGIIEFIEVFAATEVTTHLLKIAVNRKRPCGSNRSFPSGHTAVSFASSGFIQMRYGWKYGIPAYLTAAFVGYSRMLADCHYFSDVLAGAAIGLAFNLVFTKPYQEDEWQVCRITTASSVGIKVEKKF